MPSPPLLGQGYDPDALDADICVIGSGPAGGLLAVELARLGHDVLVLEAGTEAPSDPAASGLARVDVTGVADLQYSRAQQVGGSSNLWAGRVAPMEPVDFASRPWIDEAGWPIAHADLAPHYARAYRLIAHDAEIERVEAPTTLPALGAALDAGDLEIKTFAWSRPPFRVADHLARAAVTANPPRVLANAPVRELFPSPDGSSILSAAVARPSGGDLTVRARVFVLAAGGVETPRLLLASRSVRPAGIGNEHDMVGRYFSTHPKADMAALVLDRPVPVGQPLFMDRKASTGVVLRGGLGFSAEAQARLGLLNHYVQLAPGLEQQASKAFALLKRRAPLNTPLIQTSSFARGLVAGAGLMAFEAIGRVAGLQSRARVFTLRGFLDQRPHPDNRLTLSQTLDHAGAPKIDLHWRFRDQDRVDTLAFFRALDQEVRRHGLGRVEYSGLEAAGDWPITGLHSHFLGATRMGDDPRSSVVDGDGRVHGCSNLYVCGPSVFPTYGWANPFLTIAALSLRMADGLHRQRNSAHQGMTS